MGRERVFVGESLDLDRLERVLQSIVRRVNKTASVHIPAIPISFGFVSSCEELNLICKCVIPSKGTIKSIVYKGVIPAGIKPSIIVQTEDALGKRIITLSMKSEFQEAAVGVSVDRATIVSVFLSEKLSEFSAAILFEPSVEDSTLKTVVLDSIISEVESAGV